MILNKVTMTGAGGILPDTWPVLKEGELRGYAGGLGPDNIDSELKRISEAVKDNVIWIDMETKVRSNGDKDFDLTKVETCLQISQPYTLKI